MDIDKIRRANIKLLEDLHGASTLAKKAGMSPSQFYNLRDGAKDSKTGKPRGMRKETAWKIEDAAGVPRGFLDLPHQNATQGTNYINFDLLNVRAGAGPGKLIQSDSYEVIENISVREDWAAKNLGGNFAKIKVITAQGTSMQDTINNGDILFVDTTVRSYSGDGVYLIVRQDEAQVKRLQKLHNNCLAIISDNKLFDSEKLNENESDSLLICGRVLASWSFKRMW